MSFASTRARFGSDDSFVSAEARPHVELYGKGLPYGSK